MTSHSGWMDDHPQPPRLLPYAILEWQRAQDIRQAAAEQMAREARAVAEALIQKVQPASFDDEMAQALLDCGLGQWR